MVKINFESLEKVDLRTHLIIFGYLRQLQQLLLNENSVHNVYIDTPLLINYKCLLFYIGGMDYFFRCGRHCELLNNNKLIKHLKLEWGNATFGKHEILSTSQGIHKWTLQNKSNNRNFNVGISSINKRTNRIFDTFDAPFYAYSVGLGRKKSTDITHWINYGEGIPKPNDSITVELDLYKKQISFYVNGENQGIAFRNIKTGNNLKYCLAVTILEKSEIELIEYTFRDWN